jgi:hypothetical protein
LWTLSSGRLRQVSEEGGDLALASQIAHTEFLERRGATGGGELTQSIFDE